MQKRGMRFGDYVTAAAGWTLTGCKVSSPEPKTYYVDKPGGDGSWDLSSTLTDGRAQYKDRELIATFELSIGDRATRDALIRMMFSEIHGRRVAIELPDCKEDYYMVGRVSVTKDYNDMAHAAVTVKATCEPWLYSYAPSVWTVTAHSTEQTKTLPNNGARAVVPSIYVEGENASVVLIYGNSTIALSEGVYKWPELLLVPGYNPLKYKGTGTIRIEYQEAVLE